MGVWAQVLFIPRMGNMCPCRGLSLCDRACPVSIPSDRSPAPLVSGLFGQVSVFLGVMAPGGAHPFSQQWPPGSCCTESCMPCLRPIPWLCPYRASWASEHWLVIITYWVKLLGMSQASERSLQTEASRALPGHSSRTWGFLRAEDLP